MFSCLVDTVVYDDVRKKSLPGHWESYQGALWHVLVFSTTPIGVSPISKNERRLIRFEKHGNYQLNEKIVCQFARLLLVAKSYQVFRSHALSVPYGYCV